MRLVRRARRAFEPPPGVKSDIDLLCALAARLGRGQYFSYSSGKENEVAENPGREEAIFAELGRASAGGIANYAGISYERIETEQGVFWPCPTPEHPGTPRLFRERFYTLSGKACFHAVRHQAPAEVVDREYPLYLTTGRVLAQYQSGTQTRRVKRLCEIAREPLVTLHPMLAQRYGLRDGDAVRLTTRRGSAIFTARVSAETREDTIFVPFHWGGEQAINNLTNPALDPTSRMPEFKVCAVRIEPALARMKG